MLVTSTRSLILTGFFAIFAPQQMEVLLNRYTFCAKFFGKHIS